TRTTSYLLLQPTAGNVGIGSASPAQKLDVVGNVQFSGALMPNGQAGTSNYLLTSAGAGSPPTWQNPATLIPAYTLWSQNLGALYPKNSTVDFLLGATSTASAKMSVINLNSGTPTMEIKGDFKWGGLGSNKIGTLTSNTTQTTMRAPAGVAMGIGANGGNSDIYISALNNVGIGTTTPTALLDIAGAATSSATLSFRGTTDPKINVLNGENFGIQTSVGGDAGLTERLTILNGGNVGIGSTTPSQKLDVAGSLTLGGGESILFTGTSNKIVNASGTDLGFQTSNQWNVFLTAGGNVGIGGTAANSTPTLLATSAGNVGIGTTNPNNFKLQVNGNVGAQTNNTSTLGSSSVRWANIYSVLGNYSGQITSSLATGTSPFAVSSTTVNTNLNADLLDGQHGSYYLPAGNVSGTTNYVAKFTGTNSVGNSNIFDNGTNVGIGTTSPNTKLHLLGDLTITGGIRPATDGTTALQLQKANGTSVLDVDTTNSNVLVSGKLIANGFVIDKTNQDMLISRHTGGEVAFRSQTTNGRSQIILSPNGAPTYSRARMMFGLTDIIADPTNVENMTFAARGDTNEYWISTEAIGTGTARPIVFKRYQQGASPSTIDIMRLMTDGNVGIGTTTVPDLLTVRTTTNDVGITLAGASSGVSPTYKLADSGGTVHARIGIAGAAGNLVTNASINDLVFRNNAKNIHFTTDNGTSTSLFVGSNGRVGIGTTSPSYAFQANGPVDTNIISAQVTSSNRKIGLAVGDSRVGLHLRNDGTSHMGISSDGSDIFFGNASSSESPDNWGADLMTIKNGGNVGIGTTGPTQKLDVNGNVILSATSPYLYFENTNNYLLSSSDNLISKIAGSYYFRDTNSYDRLSILSTGDTTINNASNGNIATFKNSGNVGIGTTSPTAKLQVAGTLLVQPTGNSTSSLTLAPGGTSNRSFLSIFATSDTTTNYTKLYTDQALGAHAFITTAGGTGTQYPISFNSTLTNPLLYINPNGNIGIGGTDAGATPKLFVDGSSGNVGIGTTNPTSLLHINGSGAMMKIVATANDPVLFFNNLSQNWYSGIDTSDSNKFKIATSTLGSGYDMFVI
ncbi:MAG TPA: hypothetical protein PKH60_04660, partial [Candidatus Woesebacteria bacterium]|nr:hypothetical protein [Candidatus Woesebacteria bacterium]